jgi:cathepsin L
MKTFAVAATLTIASAYEEMDNKFMRHCAKYNLSWESIEEYSFRRNLFAATDAFIAEHNAGDFTYTVGHNKLSTWTEDELAKIRGLKKRLDTQPREYVKVPAAQTNQTGVNWITAGCVTPVKDQGNCGSCWTFSATGALEGAHCIKAGPANLLSFSEQQIIDCCGSRYSCSGCNGGYQEQVYNYWETNFAMLESAYPYQGVDGVCQYNPANTSGVGVVSWAWVNPYVVTDLKNALAQQPVSISVDAMHKGFDYYTGGVLLDPHCGVSLDHAVLMVGWGYDAASGLEYWNVKNSWGADWG